MRKKNLVLIDGHALAFRMFFALERTNMQTTDHTPTWAVYGFFRALFDILQNKEIYPNAIGVAFDVSRKTFRTEKYEYYKANRESMPDSLHTQLGLIIEGLNAFNIPIYTKEGFEADDVIGTISRRASKNDIKTYILTGDKDSFQLVDRENTICVLIPSGGDMTYYNWDKVYEKMGVYPNQIVDYKALCGDTSDNIPGIKGIGAKTACNLLSSYKTLDGVYQNIDETKGALKEKLINGKEMAYMSQMLATIVDNVEIDFDFKEACIEFPDKEKVNSFFKKLQFYKFIHQIDKILGYFSQNEENICKENIVKFKEPLIGDGGQLGIFGIVEEAKEEEHLTPLQEVPFIDFKNKIKENELISIYIKENEIFISKNGECTKTILENAKEILKNEKIKKILFDVKEILNIAPHIKGVECDIMLSSYIKDSSRNHDLINQIQDNLGIVASENMSPFEFSNAILRLYEFYDKNLDDDEKKLLSQIELPLSFVLKKMENRGVSIDCNYLGELSKILDSQMKFYETKIYDTAGCSFNINSPKQVGEILFDKMGIKSKKKTKTGYSTSAKILEDLALDYEIAQDILEFRTLAKLKNTYIDTLPKLIKEDGRIHTHFNQIITTTGRLSSSDPNLQNIPIRTELGSQIRRAFVPKDRENCLIVSADYSQIELRLLAHYSKDKALTEAFLSDIDIHTLTASKIFGVDTKLVTKEMRRKAKAVNFGIVYGQTRYGLASTLGITPYEAQNFIDKYFMTYPRISNYINETLTMAHQEGYVSTIFNRKRYLKEELNSRNGHIREFAERAAINAPLQGSAADLIKIAMIDIEKKLENFKSKMIIQVHDELVLEVYKDEFEEVKNIVKNSMELKQPLSIPLVVDIEAGESWGSK